jgi:hypothetical protein
VKRIPLTQDKEALVDDEDYDELARYNWRTQTNGCRYYAIRHTSDRRSTKLMHAQITGYARTDHIDGDGLNNTRANLRAATAAQNARNRLPIENSASRFMGVRQNRRKRRWVATIKTGGVTRWLGTFDSEEDAARAYDKASFERDPEFCYLNFPEEYSS